MGTGYSIIVFLHVLAAIVWLGAGLLVQVIATIADRRRDEPGFATMVRYSAELGLKLFLPASALVFVFGALAVAEGPFTIDQAWVVIGLAGYAATFLTGLLILKPRGEALAEQLAEAGGALGPEATFGARRLLILGRLDYVVLVAVVFAMVAKPSWEATLPLVIIAAIVLGGVATGLGAARRLEAQTA